MTLSRSSGETLAAGGKIKNKILRSNKGKLLRSKNYGKMRGAFFTRSRSVTLSHSRGEMLGSGGKLKKLAKQQRETIAKQKLRKNALSIFHEVKVRDLVAIQRRDAGRAKHEILKNKKARGTARPHTPRFSLHFLYLPGRRCLPYFSKLRCFAKSFDTYGKH